MNCYQCGSPSLPDQNFCRSCGTSLQVITKPFAEYNNVADLEKTAASIPKVAMPWMRIMMLGGFSTIFIGIAIALIGATMIQEKIVVGTGTLLMVIGMFLLGFTSLWHSTRPRLRSNPQPETLTPSPPITYLPQESKIEDVPTSITDRTTSLLKYPAATNLRQQESQDVRSK